MLCPSSPSRGPATAAAAQAFTPALHRPYPPLTRRGNNANVRKRMILLVVALLLAMNAALLVVAPGQALPRSLGAYFFGPKMVRAEVIIRDGNATRDFRLDRGRVRAIGRDSITLLERDGTIVVVPVASNAEILHNGRRVQYRALRRGQEVVTVRESGRPADVVRIGG
jgi:hypothetical protein